MRGNATQNFPNDDFASYANDGNFDIAEPCSHTGGEQVWWQVDLLELYLITKVAITNNEWFGSKCILQMLFFQIYFQVSGAMSFQ